jgi:hypothetical protein
MKKHLLNLLILYAAAWQTLSICAANTAENDTLPINHHSQ